MPHPHHDLLSYSIPIQLFLERQWSRAIFLDGPPARPAARDFRAGAASTTTQPPTDPNKLTLGEIFVRRFALRQFYLQFYLYMRLQPLVRIHYSSADGGKAGRV